MRELRRKAIKSVRGAEPVLRSPKRQPERDFIMFLQVDYFNATIVLKKSKMTLPQKSR
jgi:hypothetical protein